MSILIIFLKLYLVLEPISYFMRAFLIAQPEFFSWSIQPSFWETIFQMLILAVGVKFNEYF